MIEGLSEQEVRERLKTALGRLVQRDRHLFAVDANERSLTHRLGVYLEQLFAGWHVDCEYNRRGDAKKQIRDYPPDTTTDDDQGRTVYPDVIVHQRGKPRNLLAVEVKKLPSTARSADDLYKLGQYAAPSSIGGLGYDYGAFVLLSVSPREPGYSINKWICGSIENCAEARTRG